MFPIPWNKLFRKKDGSITTLDDAISSGGGGGGALSYVEYTLNSQIQGDGSTYYEFNAPTGKTPVSAVVILDESSLTYNNPYLLMSLTKENKFGYKWYARLHIDESGSVFNIKGKLRVYYIDET